jgi:hypothetical protein
MATEILLNDGGAPARILPFTANGAISGGEVVEIELSGTAGDVLQAKVNSVVTCGVSLTDAADNGPANIITGHGVILNISATGAVAIGDLGAVSAAGVLIFTATAADLAAAGTDVAIALETRATTAAGLVKCMWLR